MYTISYEDELKLTKALLHAAGMPEADAALVGEVTTHSDFTGVYSHGLSRLTRYVEQLQKGTMNPDPQFRVTTDDKAVLTCDCGGGSGILAVSRVYELVRERAREYGIAIGTGMHGANIGCGSYYGWRAVRDDMICLVCCNTFVSMAPYGGAEKLIGTNPIIVGVPTMNEYPLVMDISTSGVAMGKIKAYAREGKPIPLGWANDEDGRPTTDSRKAYSVVPVGAHKGYGLAVMVDIFSAVLAGAAFGRDIGGGGKPDDTGFCVVVIDPSKFMPLEQFKQTADEYVRMIKTSRPADGVNEIFLPGEIEFKKFESYKKSGFEVSDALASELCSFAASLGLSDAGTELDALIRSL